MPLQNRVTPMGELIAEPARGMVYGNRGCLHDDSGVIRRRYSGKRWIACQLKFRGWHRAPLMHPGHFTELFFLDEATALAAGHRPCALCRRQDYVAFQQMWSGLHPGPAGADQIDERLHSERVDPVTREHRMHHVLMDDLPDGSFVMQGRDPFLVLGPKLLRWTAFGYTSRVDRPKGQRGLLITPPSLVGLLRADRQALVPLIHPSAKR